jgi:hypothetical protein
VFTISGGATESLNENRGATVVVDDRWRVGGDGALGGSVVRLDCVAWWPLEQAATNNAATTAR